MQTSMNEIAAKIVADILNNADFLDCKVEEVNEATIIDVGVNVVGTDRLGQMVSEIGMGGLGVVKLSKALFGDLVLPIAIVATDRPKQAILCSQFGGWRIKLGDFTATAAGPANSLAYTDSLRMEMNCKEESELGVILLESRQMPTPKVVEYLAERCGISNSDLFCIVSPAASNVGSIRFACRVIESGLLKLRKLGFHPDKVRSAYGVAPIAPVTRNDNRAIEIFNGCIMHGGRVFFYVRAGEDEDLRQLTSEVPSSFERERVRSNDSSAQLGVSHQDLDSLCIGPAEATLTDIGTKESYSSGAVNSAALKKTLSSY